MSPDKITDTVTHLCKTNMPIPLTDRELVNAMVTPVSSPDDDVEEIASRIMGIYFEVLGRVGRIPTLFELHQDITEFNKSIVYDHCMALVAKDAEDSTDMYEIDDLADTMAEDMYFTEYESMWDYNGSYSADMSLIGTIIKILDTLGYSYVIDIATIESGFISGLENSVSGELQSIATIISDNDLDIIANSGQNVLFPEFLVDGISGGGKERGFLCKGGLNG